MRPGPAKQFNRDETLARAMDLFWCQGYEKSGMNELLEQMQIGRQSLYNTFGSKRNLFLEALDQYQEMMVGPILEILEAPGSPLGNLRRLLDHWQQMAEEHGSKGCLLGRSTLSFGGSDDEISQHLHKFFLRLEDGFFQLFERAREMGELKPQTQSRSLARMFVTTSQGLALMSQIQDEEYVRNLLDTLLSLLPTP